MRAVLGAAVNIAHQAAASVFIQASVSGVKWVDKAASMAAWRNAPPAPP